MHESWLPLGENGIMSCFDMLNTRFSGTEYMDYKNASNFCVMPEIEIQPPRVYVRKMGGEYTEIVGVRSFEKNDYVNSSGEISFVIAGKQTDSVNNILHNQADKYVDVKMEFLLGSLMVMRFSGLVDHYTDNAVSFVLSTPIATDVIESTDMLH